MSPDEAGVDPMTMAERVVDSLPRARSGAEQRRTIVALRAQREASAAVEATEEPWFEGSSGGSDPVLVPPAGIDATPPDGAPVSIPHVSTESPVLGATLRPPADPPTATTQGTGESPEPVGPGLDDARYQEHWSVEISLPHLGRHTVPEVVADPADPALGAGAQALPISPIGGIGYVPPPESLDLFDPFGKVDPAVLQAAAELEAGPRSQTEPSVGSFWPASAPLSRRARREAEQAVAVSPDDSAPDVAEGPEYSLVWPAEAEPEDWIELPARVQVSPAQVSAFAVSPDTMPQPVRLAPPRSPASTASTVEAYGPATMLGRPVPVSAGTHSTMRTETRSEVGRLLPTEPAPFGPLLLGEPAPFGPLVLAEPAPSGPLVLAEPAPSGPLVLAEPAAGVPVALSSVPRPMESADAAPSPLDEAPLSRLRAVARQEDGTAQTRTTTSIPVIRPPATIRRPGESVPTSETSWTGSVRVVPPEGRNAEAKALFSSPSALRKAAQHPLPGTGGTPAAESYPGPGSYPGSSLYMGSGPAAPINASLPTAAPAMPRPVPPKPLSLSEASGSLSETPGQEAPAPHRTTVTVTLPPAPVMTATTPPAVRPQPQPPALAAASPAGNASATRVAAVSDASRSSTMPSSVGDTPPTSGRGRPEAHTLSSAWPADLSTDSARPASTIVPMRGRPGSKKRKKASRQALSVAEERPVPFLQESVPELEDVDDAEDRGRLLSAIVFWAPALVLLILAAVVVWVVR